MKNVPCWSLLRLTTLVLIIAGFSGVYASQALEDTTEAWKTTEGAVIKARIRTAYMLNRQLNELRINVDTEGRHVTLKGVVPSGAIRDLAAEIALHADGVRSVKNELQVSQEQRAAPEPVNRPIKMARAHQ